MEVRGGADIVGDGAQQVGPHFLFFVFHPQLLLLLCLGGQGAGDDGDAQKGQKAQGIAGEGEVQGQIRVSKHVVDADDAQQSSHKTV